MPANADQDGTAAGNVAWTALAMLALFDATQDLRWREAALHLGKWLSENTADSRGAGGFSGGIDGFDARGDYGIAGNGKGQAVDDYAA